MHHFESYNIYDGRMPAPTVLKDRIQKPPFYLSDHAPAKKWLFSHVQDDVPQTTYTEQDAAARLAWPSGYIDGGIFDGPVSDMGIQGGLGMHISSWGRRPSGGENSRLRLDLGLMATARRAYEGPVYLQGQNPTCNAWTAIHALLTAGIAPSAELASDLLNGALPREKNGPEGISTFAVAALVENYCAGQAKVNIPVMSMGKLPVRQVARFVKDTVDGSGAVLATVDAVDRNGTPTPHAVCVAGYNLNEQGYMDVQVIDSACGVGALTVEGLTRAMRDYVVPLASLVKC